MVPPHEVSASKFCCDDLRLLCCRTFCPKGCARWSSTRHWAWHTPNLLTRYQGCRGWEQKKSTKKEHGHCQVFVTIVSKRRPLSKLHTFDIQACGQSSIDSYTFITSQHRFSSLAGGLLTYINSVVTTFACCAVALFVHVSLPSSKFRPVLHTKSNHIFVQSNSSRLQPHATKLST